MSATPASLLNDDASQFSRRSHVFRHWFAVATNSADDQAVPEAQGQQPRWLAHFSVLCLVLCVMLLGACSIGPKVVNHAFGFSAGTESPGYEIVAYRYGDGKGLSRSSDNAIRQCGSSNQWTGISGLMPLGDTLYVKWRNKTTDQVFEKTIDLKPLLPKDMTHQRIHFVVAEEEVFVYLKDMNRYAKPSDPIVGPFKAQLFVTRQIHP